MKAVPTDTEITIADLIADPYPIYRRLRAEAPVLRVQAVGRTFLTKAADTKYAKETPELFSSNDPNTPMKRAFRAHTLMRKDGEEHARERNAMASAFSAAAIRDAWLPRYREVAETMLDGLPRGETFDLFPALASPFAARCLAIQLGIEEVGDAEMQRWSQILIDGAGNFGWDPALFAETDAANDEMDAAIQAAVPRHRAEKGPSALSAMVNAEDPIPMSQIHANIKIAIGGGINEPRDALLTVLYGLLTDPGQRAAVTEQGAWGAAFDEAIRWCAPIQVSSRLVLEDTELRGFVLRQGETVMTIQASANHDEEIWDDPERFDASRPRGPHQAFGNGPHFCLGKHIARRMLADLLLPMLFERFPNMVLADPDRAQFRGFGFRGPASLPVTLT